MRNKNSIWLVSDIDITIHKIDRFLNKTYENNIKQMNKNIKGVVIYDKLLNPLTNQISLKIQHTTGSPIYTTYEFKDFNQFRLRLNKSITPRIKHLTSVNQNEDINIETIREKFKAKLLFENPNDTLEFSNFKFNDCVDLFIALSNNDLLSIWDKLDCLNVHEFYTSYRNVH